MWLRKKKKPLQVMQPPIDQGSPTIEEFDERTERLIAFPYSDLCIMIQRTRYAIGRKLPLEKHSSLADRERIEAMLLPIKIAEMKILREEMKKLMFTPLTPSPVTDKTE
mgnify:CR=1 FL=1